MVFIASITQSRKTHPYMWGCECYVVCSGLGHSLPEGHEGAGACLEKGNKPGERSGAQVL